jgi:hypothetical protein
VNFKLDIVAGHEMVNKHCCDGVYLEVLVASTAGILALRSDANIFEKRVNLVKIPE